jgi:alanine-synthesizing transaminase
VEQKIPLVCANPVGSGRNALGAGACAIARRRRAALGPDRLQPDRCGFTYDAASILAPLSDPGPALRAESEGPAPRGEAVSRYYRDHGATVDPEQIFLTTSTSEAYSFLFRLLCDPGDEVLIGQPGYPLFDFLAQLDDVRLVPYELFYDHGWHLDLEALRRRVTPRTRAIAVVHPNNPTGHFTRHAERARSKDCAASMAWR